MISTSLSGLPSCIVLIVVFLSSAFHAAYGSIIETKPVLFIFGDSTADVGTNNFLNTQAKANAPYYGIDFPNSVPTGRFSNGFNTIDRIAQLFGYVESPPPYLALRLGFPGISFSKLVLGGVNFASGGSGIHRTTGERRWGEVVPLEKQVQQFAVAKASMAETLGTNQTALFLSNALFIISVGGNDIMEFNTNYSSLRLGQKQFLSLLQFNFFSQIQNLYALGARRFAIINVAKIGCCPAVTVKSGGECVDPLNQLAIDMNSATASMLQKLSSDVKDFKYSLGGSFAMTSAVLADPTLFGIKDTKRACCGIGKLNNGEGPCLKALNATLCEDRNDFLFWDWFHPTDNASRVAASTLFNGTSPFVTPINFSQLAQV